MNNMTRAYTEEIRDGLRWLNSITTATLPLTLRENIDGCLIKALDHKQLVFNLNYHFWFAYTHKQSERITPVFLFSLTALRFTYYANLD